MVRNFHISAMIYWFFAFMFNIGLIAQKRFIKIVNTALYKFHSDAFVYTFNWEGRQYFSSYLLQGLVVFTGGVLCSGALSNKRQAFFISKQENLTDIMRSNCK